MSIYTKHPPLNSLPLPLRGDQHDHRKRHQRRHCANQLRRRCPAALLDLRLLRVVVYAPHRPLPRQILLRHPPVAARTPSVRHLHRLNVQLLRATRTRRVHHEQDQVAVRDLLHTERPFAARRVTIRQFPLQWVALPRGVQPIRLQDVQVRLQVAITRVSQVWSNSWSRIHWRRRRGRRWICRVVCGTFQDLKGRELFTGDQKR